MINYDSKNWFEAIGHFKTSYVIRRTMRMCLGAGGYAAMVAVVEHLLEAHPSFAQLNISMGLEPGIFSLLGVFLSLMLVFRTNTAYDRWWEGRKLWGSLVNHTRGIAVRWHGLLSREDHTNRVFFARALTAYAKTLSDHLRGQAVPDLLMTYSGESRATLAGYTHLPNKIARDIWERGEFLYRDQFIDGFQYSQVQPEVQHLLDIHGACERIRATPIPFAHNFFIKLFILAYCSLLPFVLVPVVGYYAILLTMFVVYALVGLEYISVEIEEPFGTDCNDLPTHDMALRIGKQVHEILEVSQEETEHEVTRAYIVIS
ncbi:MAG: bestrophin family ion channel [Bacteroidia bacterium]|nr:bestrophin family ion channel [Bacteroidia bacterium]